MQNLSCILKASWIAVAICILAFQGFSQTKVFEPRHFYGEKFELQDKVIHGLGQGLGTTRVNAAKDYKNMFPGTKQPLIYNTYKRIDHLVRDTAQFTRDINKLTTTDKYMAVMISLAWHKDQHPIMPTASEFDAAANALKGLDRPIFLRIEFEYNGSGSWKDYNASEVKSFYKNMADALERSNVTNVARVWTIAADRGGLANAMTFYPGDRYVDWFGIDVFHKDHFNNALVNGLVAEAELRKKPIFLPELSPRHVGVDQASDWDNYFVQLFDFIREHESVKAFNYIHHDWSDWPDFEDSKISDGDATLRNNYIAEINQSWFYHGNTQSAVWSTLNPYPPYIDPDQWYVFENRKNGKYLANKPETSDAVAWNPKLNNMRRWRFEASSLGGNYHIISQRDGKYLAHRGIDQDAVVWSAEDRESRRWRLERSEVDSFYNIISENQGLYLANRTTDSNVVVWSANDNDSRQWKLIPAGEVNSRVASIINKHTIPELHQQKQEIVCFPNPVTHQLSLYYPGDQAKFTFVSLQGQKLMSSKSRGGKIVISTADLPRGIVLLQIQLEDGLHQRRIVIK